MVGRGAFDEERLKSFWRFVAERQRIWFQRVVRGVDPPWTTDAALKRHRFTNVYRVLDPGTQYVIREILGRAAPDRDRLFNVLIYRLIGRDDTHASAGFQRLESYDPCAFEAALRDVVASGRPVFTGAYTVSGYGWVGGADKIENVALLLEEVRDRFDEIYAAVTAANGPEAVYSAVRGVPGFGNFLAYQVLVDLLYPVPSVDGEPFLPFSPNAWASAGPGARRGLDVLLAGSVTPSTLEAMTWLWRHQVEEFDRLGIEYVPLREADGDRIDLSLADVQNCCCEFSKVHRLRTGEGRPRRRFRPKSRRPRAALRAWYDDYGIALEPRLYVDDVEEIQLSE